MNPTKALAHATLVIACALNLAGCGELGLGGGPRIQVAGGNDWHAGMSIPNVPPGGSWIVRGISLCLDESGPVEIERVALNGSAAAVEAFTLQDNPGWRGGTTYGDELGTDHPGSLKENGFDAGEHDVVHVCDPPQEKDEDNSGKGHELLLEVRAPEGGQVARFDGFDVIYSRGGDEEDVHVPLEIVLCPTSSEAGPACALD